MISKVRMKNWRSHEDSELVFGPGTNALLGIIGSGKSSVLDAVCFCLFGTFPNLQARKLKIDDMMMRKPSEKSKAEVEVHFASDGKEYSVKRVIEKGRGTTHSEVREGNRIVESPNTSRVNELVEKLLKVNYDLFSKAIYSEQNSLDYFLTIPRGQRMKKIDELLAIDRFEKARSTASLAAKRLLDLRSAKVAAVDSSRSADVQRTMSEIKSSMAQVGAQGAEMEEKMNALYSRRTQLEKELGDQKRLRDAIRELRNDEASIARLIKDTEESLLKVQSQKEDAGALEREMREVMRYLSEMDSIMRDEQRKFQRVQAQLSKAAAEVQLTKEKRLDALEAELKAKLEMKAALREHKISKGKMEEELEEKKAAVEKLVAEMEVCGMRIRDLKDVIESLNALEGRCPTCDTKMTEEKKAALINKKKFEIQKLNEKFAKSGEKKDMTKREAEDLEAALSKLNEMLDAVKDIDKTQAELNGLKNVYAVLVEQQKSFEKEFEQTRRDLEVVEKGVGSAKEKRLDLEGRMRASKEYAEKLQKMVTLGSSREQLEAGIRSLESQVTMPDIDSKEREWAALLAEEKQISGKISGVSEILREKMGRLEELESAAAKAEADRQEAERLGRSAEQMKVFERALEATQLQLRKEFVASVNYTMNELWSNLYPYRDFTGIQLSIEEGDYVLQLQENPGRWVNVEGFASGGERSIAALTLRMAFALVLAPQLKWLVLDEPTANMDAKSVEDLATTLSEHIGDFIEQTFLITHDEKLEKAVTGYAYRLERDKANHGPTRVVQI